MNIFVACAVTGAISFVFGIIFGKNVVSEAHQIKEHISAEISKVRADVAAKLGRG